MPKYIAIAAVTLDGKIAKDSEHLSTEWTSEEDKIIFRKLLKECDAVLVGRKTWETAMGHLSKRNCIVLTRSVEGIKKENEKLVFINSKKTDLKTYIINKGYQKVAILGGSQVYTYCLENEMLDELYLTVEPIVFSKGVDLFASQNFLEHKFKLVSMEKLNEQGTMFIHYSKNFLY